jgi:hypothetical protein
MNQINSYFVLLGALQECYRRCPEDLLGATLGGMDPNLWEDYRPMNEEIYQEWVDSSNYQSLDPSNAAQTICKFLEHLKNRDPFYDFPQAIQTIQNMTQQEWNSLFQEADRKSQNYHF